MSLRLTHTPPCQGWAGVYCAAYPGCRVWRSTVWAEAWSNLRCFFAIRYPPLPASEGEIESLRHMGRRRRRIVRLLRARRMERYAAARLRDRRQLRRA